MTINTEGLSEDVKLLEHSRTEKTVFPWKPVHFWNKFPWADELKCNSYYNDEKRRIWRKKGRALDPKPTTSDKRVGHGNM